MVIFTFPHRSTISLAHHGKKKVCKEKSLQRKKFANIQLKENLQGFFDYAFVTTATKIKARQNLPSEGPGTGLANPSIHLDAVLAKLHYVN